MRRAVITSPPMRRSGFGAAGWRSDSAVRAPRPSADTRELTWGAESMPSAASGTLARDELRFACGLERRKWEKKEFRGDQGNQRRTAGRWLSRFRLGLVEH